MIVIIDNLDSFTYNLVQYFQILGEEVRVIRNYCTIEDVLSCNPDYIVISPGPGTPQQAGISKELIRYVQGTIPILGVCLGHQCIAEVFDGKIIQADNVMHGKTSNIVHSEKSIFKDIPNNFAATRYHSLIVDRDSLPSELEIIAETEDKEIMAIQHIELPIIGIQFHPESIITQYGLAILKNFLSSRALQLLSAL